MEIILRVITCVIITTFIPIVINLLMPKFKKAEIENEQKAKDEQSVKLSKDFFAGFLVLIIIVNVVGILIVALPHVVTEHFGFNYKITLIVWWLPLIFDNAVGYFLFTKATYDDEKIVVKKLFRKPKEYYFRDITHYTISGNLRVKTPYGSFLLFNVFAGTSTLRKLIIQKFNPGTKQ